jgi:hypothetical protein
VEGLRAVDAVSERPEGRRETGGRERGREGGRERVGCRPSAWVAGLVRGLQA